MKTKQLIKNFQKTYLYRAFRAIYYTYTRTKDKLSGVDFSASKSEEESGKDHQYGNHYTPSTLNGLKTILQKLPINNSDKIIDIGCGKGKAMYLMTKFPFKQVDGYEISPELCDIARTNFSRLKIEKTNVFCADATDFNEYDEYKYIYIFNSVPKSIFEVVLKNIKDSIIRNPRKIYFICLNPIVYHNIILQDKTFSIAFKYKAYINWFDLNCYTNNINC